MFLHLFKVCTTIKLHIYISVSGINFIWVVWNTKWLTSQNNIIPGGVGKKSSSTKCLEQIRIFFFRVSFPIRSCISQARLLSINSVDPLLFVHITLILSASGIQWKLILLSVD